MKKCIVISDSFKGTISSLEIAKLTKTEILKEFPKCNVVELPIADGGEGTIDAFAYFLKGKFIKKKVSGPYFEKANAKYFLSDENVAFIEMASAAGLPLVGDKKDPSKTTTYGVGELILDAINKGAKKIILGLGGSATNDGGCGCCAALKTKFINKDKNEFIPVGGTLNNIETIDVSLTNELLKNVEIICMSDVINPMHGTNGAAYIFAPQKGANEDMVKILNSNLISLDKAFKNNLKKNVSKIPGTGAAGAFGSGALAILNAKIESGIETLLRYSKFDDELNGTDLIITGEGNFDSQSMQGKVIYGIKEHAKLKKVPVIVVAGGINQDSENEISKNNGISAIFSTTRKPMAFKDLIPYSKQFYKSTIQNIIKLIKISENFNK